ncbi:hypothetical protein M514_03014 [Trichuris suis]|uniref:AAA+ ATPase domain-containing protein n=2 Tax=Trichuris suis TaxID=68888 RepID=A0A085NI06_9BILA|nr:hypothetical protein M514_03014 [Trichuris suis]
MHNWQTLTITIPYSNWILTIDTLSAGTEFFKFFTDQIALSANSLDFRLQALYQGGVNKCKRYSRRDSVRSVCVLGSTKMVKAAESLPWVEKYRPTKLEELVSQKDIIHTLSSFMKEDILPHLLFYGPPGTGKTTTILACARQLYDVKQFSSMLNASDDRGIGVVREQILTFASTKNIFSKKFKLVILDEADSMTRDAQNALRRIIEKFTNNVRFCLICNYLSKIIPPVQSRCMRFRFGPLKSDEALSRLRYVVDEEKVKYDMTGLEDIVALSGGDMRRALNILQSTVMAFDVVNRENVYACVGYPKPDEILTMFNCLLNEDVNEAYKHITEMRIQKGLALQDILTSVHEYIHRVKMPSLARILLMDRMAQIEDNLSKGASDKIQLSALIASFQIARDIIAKEAKVVE